MYDVIVIGLGAMGSAALYQAARRNANVLGIDAYTPPHSYGSSHGETRITRQAVGEGAAYIPLVQRSQAIWKQLEAATSERLFVRSGGYILAEAASSGHFHGQTDFVTYSAQLATLYDIPHARHNAQDIRARVPMLKLTDDIHAYYEPDSGVLLPERCVSAQLTQAQNMGASVHTNERVLRVNSTPQALEVITDKATYQAQRVVMSAGAWLTDFLPPSHQAQLKIYYQRIYWFEAQDLSAFDAAVFPYLIWIGAHREDLLAVFPVVNGATAGVKLMTEQYSTHSSHADARPPQPTTQEAAAMYAQYVAPRMDGVLPNVVKTAVCAYTVTPDEHFIIDRHPQDERIVFASACSGHGFKHSAAVGEILAELALEGQSGIDITPFAVKRLIAKEL